MNTQNQIIMVEFRNHLTILRLDFYFFTELPYKIWGNVYFIGLF